MFNRFITEQCNSLAYAEDITVDVKEYMHCLVDERNLSHRSIA